MSRRPTDARGFTLIEVLAALAVVAFAVAALWKGLNQGLAVGQGLPERVVARWVAENRLVRRQVRGDWPEPRSYTGTVEMAGRDWYWREQVTNTDEARLRRVSVQVGLDEEDPSLVRLEGYLYDQPQGSPAADGNSGRDANAGGEDRPRGQSR